jgi:hypothetical protein
MAQCSETRRRKMEKKRKGDGAIAAWIRHARPDLFCDGMCRKGRKGKGGRSRNRNNCLAEIRNCDTKRAMARW